MKIVTVVGARPQFVKAAVLSRAFAARGGAIREVIVHTGQHHDPNMSDVFFEEMRLPKPDHHLGVAGGSHGEMTGRMLEKLERVLLEERPDWVLVYGDTNSTLAGALAAAKLQIRVAHVESGLRSYNRAMPEEVNRVMADHVSSLLFVPTPRAVENLREEGIAGDHVVPVGDVMFDAARHYAALATPSPAVRDWMAASGGGHLVATVHRAENTDDPARLAAILGALGDISATRPVVLPLHPRTRKAAGAWSPPATLHVVEPLGYLDTLCLLRASAGVLTDSGGLQKEAFFFGKPCLVLRSETEWVELVDGGHARLVGADRARIVSEAAAFLGRDLGEAPALYGDGRAGERIVEALLRA
ncbi:MAG: UDP-N-acetylglucosamine 2-epimerase (non-hydrolyzing) [Candidatus Eisenbacteria bacterium]|uniref:UDP-N-acetylglucosamine 2-epimerase (Non-hydrolyzing) n=1 Tax=Eiseniibacteriota bacterium TaxID=2212470 RepID=A0A933W1W2_UNCEI|nr:UDP-N-acetylglucosamine 2-epimerase (non-hydrolyzing) [Candidatus Eisenbacteria bacterium]